MKKISILACLAALLGVVSTGCKEDTQPRLEEPTEFVLNTPPAADQLYLFRADEKNKSLYDITFTVSQPNYGLGVVPDYQVQVAKSEEAFSAWDSSSARTGDREADNAITGADGLPLVNTIEYAYNNAKITVTGDVFSAAVNTVYGFDADNYSGEAVPVYVRMHSAIRNASYGSIYSNVVCLKQVSSYIPISAPGVLYLIGKPSGWDINNGAMTLTETEIGSKIYSGVFSIAEGEFILRFYTALGDWENNSLGHQVPDQATAVALDDNGVYTGPVVAGKGAWEIPDWEGGKVEIVVNMNTNSVTFTKFEGAKVYVIGACSGWNINNDKVFLTETEDGTGIYTGKVAVPEGQFTFRFYTALGDWENNSIGSQEPDSPVEISMAGGSYSGSCVKGKGAWTDPDWAGGDVKMTLNLTTMEVAFEKI